MLTGYLSEWAALEDKCKNEAFNSQDTSPLSWDRTYEELARWFGAKKGVVGPSEDESKYTIVKGRSGKETPMGYALDLFFLSSQDSVPRILPRHDTPFERYLVEEAD